MRLVLIIFLSGLLLTVSSQTLLQDAERSMRIKNYPETIKLCRSLLENEPDRDDAKILMGMAYQAMQDYQSALEVYTSSGSQESISLQYLKAECIETLGDIGSALNIYSSIFENDSTDMHAARNIARIQLKAKNYLAAKEYYEILADNYPDNYLFQKNLGVCNYQIHEEFPAMKNFKRAWELNKRDLELPINIANIYARIQEPHNALDILAEGLQYDSINTDIIKTSAFICYKLERYDTAAYQFDRLLTLGDSSQFTRKYLGISYYNRFMLDPAIENLRAAYDLDTLDTETTYYLGIALSTMHDKLEGINFLKKTLEPMTPDSTFFGSVYGAIAQAWADLNERKQSISSYEKAILYAPDQPVYVYEKARLHDQLGIMQKDRKQLNQAIIEYEKFLKKQLPIVEEVRIRRGLDADQVSTPAMDYSRKRIKEIRNELFFLGNETKY
jgi:tetratricopeptide (TPR) repeat protein